MCGAKVGCVVCEGYAFFIKNARLLNIAKHWTDAKYHGQSANGQSMYVRIYYMRL